MGYGLYGQSLFTNNQPQTLGSYGYTLFTNGGGTKGLYGYTLFPEGLKGFQGEELTVTEVYKITFTDGSIAPFTPHDQPIVLGGYTYQPVPMKRSAIKYHADFQVDKVTIDVGIIGVTAGDRSWTIPQIIRRDFMRNARVQIYAVDFTNTADYRLIFDGLITGDINFNQGILSVQVGTILDRLKDKFPKVIYSELCQHTLYDSRCSINSNTFKHDSTASTGSTIKRIYSDEFLFSNHAEGYFLNGKITITDIDSDNYGVSRSIVKHGDGYIDVRLIFVTPILAGETFSVWAGCDKTGVMCDTKFSNYVNFWGFETIPKPEIMLD